jgi:hypothetical protein
MVGDSERELKNQKRVIFVVRGRQYMNTRKRGNASDRKGSILRNTAQYPLRDTTRTPESLIRARYQPINVPQ